MTGPDILSAEECEALGRRLLAELPATAAAELKLVSRATAATAFARGDAHVASESRDTTATLTTSLEGRSAEVESNRLDPAGLAALAREAEQLRRTHRTQGSPPVFRAAQRYPAGPPIYFDATAGAMAGEAQAALFDRAATAAERAGLAAAGDVKVEALSRWVRNTNGLLGYERRSYGEFSVTARTKDGTGSGWGWSGHEDWARVEVDAVIGRAVDLAQRSAKPVAIEPGRYAVILEPAAVAALIRPILDDWPAWMADRGMSVFAKDPIGTNKIGLQMMDRRLGMVSDPWDPEHPVSTITWGWVPVPGPVTWFERGVLKNLEYLEDYAREKSRAVVVNPGGVRLTAEGAPTTFEDMVASTPRGVWVNRLSHVVVMNGKTLLLTGTTRDGTFLIQDGKITKAIKNFRFTESPFFVFNKLEAWGTPVRASRAVVAPRLKLRDFDFSSLTDAV